MLKRFPCFRYRATVEGTRLPLMKQGSHPVAPVKKIIPTATKRGSQPDQGWEAGKVLARFDALNIADTDAGFFSQRLLCHFLT